MDYSIAAHKCDRIYVYIWHIMPHRWRYEMRHNIVSLCLCGLVFLRSRSLWPTYPRRCRTFFPLCVLHVTSRPRRARRCAQFTAQPTRIACVHVSTCHIRWSCHRMECRWQSDDVDRNVRTRACYDNDNDQGHTVHSLNASSVRVHCKNIAKMMPAWTKREKNKCGKICTPAAVAVAAAMLYMWWSRVWCDEAEVAHLKQRIGYSLQKIRVGAGYVNGSPAYLFCDMLAEWCACYMACVYLISGSIELAGAI